MGDFRRNKLGFVLGSQKQTKTEKILDVGFTTFNPFQKQEDIKISLLRTFKNLPPVKNKTCLGLIQQRPTLSKKNRFDEASFQINVKIHF